MVITMLSFLKKIKTRKKKFVIILSAGRCGSTYVMRELNKIKGVNIYGENHNVFSKIAQAIYATRKTIDREVRSRKRRKNPMQDKKYTGFEWHNNPVKLKKILHQLEDSLDVYFNNNNDLNGFKEIRFMQEEDITSLQYFEEKFETYYIHLVRDLDQQAQSGFYKNKLNSRSRILKVNKNISDVLGSKANYMQVNLDQIRSDISIIKTFIGLRDEKRLSIETLNEWLKKVSISIDTKSNSPSFFWRIIIVTKDFLRHLYLYHFFRLYHYYHGPLYPSRFFAKKEILKMYRETATYNKISFCITSMDRLMHIKKTLIRNIKDNADYPNVEFVLLDYNSSDGLMEWVNKKCKRYIDSGVLRYYRIRGPKKFHMARAKNLAHSFATGDVLCGLDADNFTHKDFAFYINYHFEKNNEVIGLARDYGVGDFGGRIFVSRRNFKILGGYDESFVGWGFEDLDFKQRAFEFGLQKIDIQPFFLSCVSHSDAIREKNMPMSVKESNEKNKILFLNKKSKLVDSSISSILVRKYNLIYTPIPKAACSTIKIMIASLLNKKIIEIHSKENFHYIKNEFVSHEKFNNFLKFSFVRNPWDRLVSCYVDKVLNPPEGFHVLFTNYSWYKPKLSFEEFVDGVIQTPDEYSDQHFKSQYCFFLDKNNKVMTDYYVGRVENIDQDLQHIFQKIGVQPLEIMCVNKKSRGHYSRYYNEKTRNLVAQRYKKDIELFGYSFESKS